MDWGDLPSTYGTLLADNGPRHSNSGLKLGANFDREPNGQPVAAGTDAVGDDNAQRIPPPTVDDEDGVTPVAFTHVSSGQVRGDGYELPAAPPIAVA